jgi:hypothetical protein
MTDDGSLPPIPEATPGPGDLELVDGTTRHVRDVPTGMGLLMLAKDGYRFGPPDRPSLDPLRGATALACWCPLCKAHADGLPGGVACADCAPCHASVLADLVSVGVKS